MTVASDDVRVLMPHQSRQPVAVFHEHAERCLYTNPARIILVAVLGQRVRVCHGMKARADPTFDAATDEKPDERGHFFWWRILAGDKLCASTHL